MKKKFCILFMACCAVWLFSSLAFAASAVSSMDTCVVVVNSPKAKLPECNELIDSAMNRGKIPQYAIGDDAQKLFNQFFADKGYATLDECSDNELFAFAAQSGYKKVVFLSVSEPIMSSTKVKVGSTWKPQYYASLDMEMIVANDSSILKIARMNKENTLIGDEHSVLYKTFERCIDLLAAEI